MPWSCMCVCWFWMRVFFLFAWDFLCFCGEGWSWGGKRRKNDGKRQCQWSRTYHVFVRISLSSILTPMTKNEFLSQLINFLLFLILSSCLATITQTERNLRESSQLKELLDTFTFLSHTQAQKWKEPPSLTEGLWKDCCFPQMETHPLPL